MYATVDGYTTYTGISDLDALPTQRALDGVEARLLAYIAPRIVDCEYEAEAFEKAVYEQYDYEQADAARTILSAPPGVSGFTVGKFSMQLSGSGAAGRAPLPAGIASTAYALLFNAGLLYRGVRTC